MCHCNAITSRCHNGCDWRADLVTHSETIEYGETDRSHALREQLDKLQQPDELHLALAGVPAGEAFDPLRHDLST